MILLVANMTDTFPFSLIEPDNFVDSLKKSANLRQENHEKLSATSRYLFVARLRVGHNPPTAVMLNTAHFLTAIKQLKIFVTRILVYKLFS